MDKRVVGDWIIKCKCLFQMRPGSQKPAGKHQVLPGGQVTQNESAGIVALIAEMQQILVQALRQIEFAADRVMLRLPIGNSKELRGRTQLLPQLAGASIGMTRFRRGGSLRDLQYRGKGAQKFELLSLAFAADRQQRKL